MFSAGIDAGSRSIKVVLLSRETGEIVAAAQADQGVQQEALARRLLDQLLERIGASDTDVTSVVATGYGRNLIGFSDTTVTEITCHAHGVCHRIPEAKTIIEIGGQDSKVIHLDGSGEIRDFAMNDRCAAGTGRFLEVAANLLGVELEELGRLSRQCLEPAAISSTCVVFAETEIVGLLATGIEPANIISGILQSIARRVRALAGQRIGEPVLFTGGVALIDGMAQSLEEILARPVRISPEPQMTGALGAALLAMNHPRSKLPTG